MNHSRGFLVGDIVLVLPTADERWSRLSNWPLAPRIMHTYIHTLFKVS